MDVVKDVAIYIDFIYKQNKTKNLENVSFARV